MKITKKNIKKELCPSAVLSEEQIDWKHIDVTNLECAIRVRIPLRFTCIRITVSDLEEIETGMRKAFGPRDEYSAALIQHKNRLCLDFFYRKEDVS